MTPEGRVKDKVKRRLTAEFPTCYRFAPVQNGMGSPSLDVLYCINGCFFAIETKRPPKPGHKPPEPTPRQQTTMAEIDEERGLALLVYDDDTLEKAVVAIKRHIKLTRARLWNRAHPLSKELNRQAHIKHRHGITQEDYERMLAEQGGHCFFCERTPEKEAHGVLCIDHDHETGRIRGLVCRVHNSALRHFGDNVAGFLRVIEYLTDPADDEEFKKAA